MSGCALAALLYYPLFGALTGAANPALAQAQQTSPIVVEADPATCSFQFDPVGGNPFDTTGCDVAKRALAQTGIPYDNIDLVAGSDTLVRVGPVALPSLAHTMPPAAEADAFRTALADALDAAGYPARADPEAINKPMIVAILTILVLLVTMVYGPIAALLVELFQSRIRYTAMSLPYHIGNGWFGGFLPTIAFAMVAATGNIYAGLWYPIGIALLTLVVGLLFLPETFRRHISHSE
jgi:hypothetical protein